MKKLFEQTLELLPEIRARKYVDSSCKQCHGRGTIRRSTGLRFETDSAEERAATWEYSACSCGEDVPLLCEALEETQKYIADLDRYFDRIQTATEKFEQALTKRITELEAALRAAIN